MENSIKKAASILRQGLPKPEMPKPATQTPEDPNKPNPVAQ